MRTAWEVEPSTSATSAVKHTAAVCGSTAQPTSHTAAHAVTMVSRSQLTSCAGCRLWEEHRTTDMMSGRQAGARAIAPVLARERERETER